jgi:hypothetical protein
MGGACAVNLTALTSLSTRSQQHPEMGASALGCLTQLASRRLSSNCVEAEGPANRVYPGLSVRHGTPVRISDGVWSYTIGPRRVCHVTPSRSEESGTTWLQGAGRGRLCARQTDCARVRLSSCSIGVLERVSSPTWLDSSTSPTGSNWIGDQGGLQPGPSDSSTVAGSSSNAV